MGADRWETERRFQAATDKALATVRQQMLAAAEAKNQEIIRANHPSSYVRTIDNVVAAVDLAYQFYQLARLTQNIVARRPSVITYRYSYVDDVVRYALQVLRESSPVGSAGDKHPGLYRDSHMVFVDGRGVTDMNGWRPGQTIHISNPEPYSRKIEAGRMKLSVPGHVYEMAEPIITARYGNSFSIKFVYMPLVFGNQQAWADFTTMQRSGRTMSPKARAEWLVRQPALEIKAR